MINRPVVAAFILFYLCVGIILVVNVHRRMLIHQMINLHGIFNVLIWLSLLTFILLYWNFPHYYEVRESGLFLRQGSNMNLIPYESIYEVLPISPSLDSFWPNRISIMLMDGKEHVIAVADKERFLTEVFKKCPRLEHKGASFGF
jgi:hypothetical protein